MGWTRYLGLLRALLRRPYAIVVVVLLGLLLLSPGLLTGRLLDDHVHRLMLRADGAWPELTRAPWDLYGFLLDDDAWRELLRSRGSLPWFTDPTIHATFFRPLASLSLYLDYRLWPDSLALAHLHSMLWYVALVLVVWRLFVRVLPVQWVAVLATMLYALDDARGFPISWLANRNALIAATFGCAAVLSHVRWRQTGRRAYAAGSATLFGLGLLGGEAALGFGAYVVAYAVTLDEGSWRARLVSLSPTALVIAAWYATYATLGYGTGGSDMYIDPAASPGRFLVALVERVPVVLAALLSPLPSYLYSGSGRPVAALVALGAGAIVVALGWSVRATLKASPAMRFSALGMVGAAIPTAATFPHERLLFAPGIGGFALVATVLGVALANESSSTALETVSAEGAAPSEPAGAANEGGRARSGSIVALGLAVTHLVLGPLMLPLSAYSPELFVRAYRAAARSLDRAEDFTGKTLVMVNGPDFFFTSWSPIERASNVQSTPRRLRVLATSMGRVEVRRTGVRTLSLHAERGFGNTLFDTLLRRRSHPLEVDDCVELDDVRFRVEAVSLDGVPTTVECLFARPLDDADYVWVAWHPDGYRPFKPPELGQAVELPAFTIGNALRLVWND